MRAVVLKASRVGYSGSLALLSSRRRACCRDPELRLTADTAQKAFEIVVEDRPVPTIQADTGAHPPPCALSSSDVILKVVVTALCGSEVRGDSRFID